MCQTVERADNHSTINQIRSWPNNLTFSYSHTCASIIAAGPIQSITDKGDSKGTKDLHKEQQMFPDASGPSYQQVWSPGFLAPARPGNVLVDLNYLWLGSGL